MSAQETRPPGVVAATFERAAAAVTKTILLAHGGGDRARSIDLDHPTQDRRRGAQRAAARHLIAGPEGPLVHW